MTFLYIFLFLFFLYVIFIFSKKPNHNQNWELGQEELPKIEIENSLVKIKNLRDFNWKKEGEEVNYIKREFDLDFIEGLDIIISHFSKFEGIAHIFLAFQLKNQENITISLEARRVNGKKYSPFKGLFRNFEIIYIVATEKDLIGLRTNIRNERVYLYPTIATKKDSQELFKLLAEDINFIIDNPTFYNTLFKNCVNMMAKRVEQISALKFPKFSYKFIFPGYFDKILYDMKISPKNELDFEEFKKNSLICNDEINIFSDDFSQQIRKYLKK